MIKAIKNATLAVAAVAVVSGPVAFAAGQIEGGNIYRVRNVTQSSAFADPASATCGETVQFRVRIHNPGPDPLTGVTASATLPSAQGTSHSSTMTISSPDANPTSNNDTAGVNTNQASTLAYVAGSTQLLDPNGSVLQTLGDGIVSGGVSVPNGVGVSTQQMRFVQFSANVNCPETPVTPPTSTVKTGATPKAIASTGPAELISGLAGVSALGYGVTRYAASRRQ